MLSRRNEKSNRCAISLTNMSWELKIPIDTVNNYIDSMINKGFLQVREGSLSKFGVDNYFFPYEAFYTGIEVNEVAEKRKSRKKKENI